MRTGHTKCYYVYKAYYSKVYCDNSKARSMQFSKSCCIFFVSVDARFDTYSAYHVFFGAICLLSWNHHEVHATRSCLSNQSDNGSVSHNRNSTEYNIYYYDLKLVKILEFVVIF